MDFILLSCLFQHFWNVLESLSEEDLCRFVKFACNQERIPQTCPCRDGGLDTAHVPPYPMKIAPPGGDGGPGNIPTYTKLIATTDP